jgi:hypothetical protein
MIEHVNRLLHHADFVWLDGDVYRAQYVRLLDEDTRKDDVLVEAGDGEREFFFTRDDLEQCDDLGDGSVRLRNGSVVRFLTGATLH